MTPGFRSRPGAWERHLQRRHGNPLFPEPLCSVTPAQLEAARRRDDEESRAFGVALRELLQSVAELPEHADSDVIFTMKERIDRLYEEACGLRGDLSAEQQALKRLGAVIMSTVRQHASGDMHAQRELAQEDAARVLHYDMLRHVLVADLLRPESPIAPEELVPALLSEDEAGLRAAITLFDEAEQQALCAEARNLLTRLDSGGAPLARAWGRLAIMENARTLAGIV